MNYNGMGISAPRREYLAAIAKGIPESVARKVYLNGPRAIAEGIETKVHEGSKYKFIVVNDKADKEKVLGWRLRQIKYEEGQEENHLDFPDGLGDEYAGNFNKALEQFEKGNAEYSRILEETSRGYRKR